MSVAAGEQPVIQFVSPPSQPEDAAFFEGAPEPTQEQRATKLRELWRFVVTAATTMDANGVAKSGVGQANENLHCQPRDASALAGVVVDGAISRGLSGMSEDEQVDRIYDLHGAKPRVMRGWAERGKALVPEIIDLLKPKPGLEAIRLSQRRFYQDPKAKAAAETLNDALLGEQLHGDATPGPFERAVQAFYRSPKRRANNKALNAALRELPETFHGLTKDDIKSQLRQARGLSLAPDGKSIKLNTVRPDIIQLEYDPTNRSARKAAEAFSKILELYGSLALDELGGDESQDIAGKTVTYTDDLTGKPVGIDCLTAVHWGAEAMKAGDLTFIVVDSKLETHQGEPWEKYKNFYNKVGDNIERVFSPETLHGTDTESLPARNRFREHAYDAVKTQTALSGWIHRRECEYQAHNVHESPAVAWSDIFEAITPKVLQIDFDITKPGEGIEPGADPLLRSKTKPYKTKPDLFYTGVPTNVAMVLNEVPAEQRYRLRYNWERALRREMVAVHLVRLMAQARLERQRAEAQQQESAEQVA